MDCGVCEVRSGSSGYGRSTWDVRSAPGGSSLGPVAECRHGAQGRNRILQPCDSKFVRTSLSRLEDLRDGSATAIEITPPHGPISVILVRSGASVSAFLNVCPHAGRRLDWAPGRFLFDAGDLICAAHGARFRLADGHCLSGPCRGAALARLPVEVRDGEVWLEP
ncbi:MAG TPA: hypothetical protein DDZ76_05290 [Xanthomonadales bacterium]|nr:hypothetical protein [Xanthomonadales bacterium]HBS35426.1 hypothetical protein [Parvularcula sp.]